MMLQTFPKGEDEGFAMPELLQDEATVCRK